MKKKNWHVRHVVACKGRVRMGNQLPERVEMSSSGVYLQINMFSKIGVIRIGFH